MVAQPDSEVPPPDLHAEVRAHLERILTQIHLVELLYLRVVGLHARSMGDLEQARLLAPELERVERELRAAQAELERLGFPVTDVDPDRPPRKRFDPQG